MVHQPSGEGLGGHRLAAAGRSVEEESSTRPEAVVGERLCSPLLDHVSLQSETRLRSQHQVG